MLRSILCVIFILTFLISPVAVSRSDYYDSFDLKYSLELIEDPMATLYGYFVDNDFTFDEAYDAFFLIYDELGKYR